MTLTKYRNHSDDDLRWNLEGLQRVVTTGRDARDRVINDAELARMRVTIIEIKAELRGRDQLRYE